MKKSVYISGIACTLFMLLGCLLKIMHWPGANILLILSTVLFCFFFLPAALTGSYTAQPENKRMKLLHIVTYVVFFIGMMGTLFKIMHWPGASLFLVLGLPLPFILFLPVYLYSTKEKINAEKDSADPAMRKNKSLNFLGVMFGLTFLAVFSVLLSLNVSRQVLANAANDVDNNDRLAAYAAGSSPAAAKTGVKESAEVLCSFIDELKCELLMATDNMGCDGKKPGSDYDPAHLNNIDAAESVLHVLYGASGDKIVELKNRMADYRKALLASGQLSAGLSELVNDLFDVSDQQQTDESGETTVTKWEQREIPTYRLVFVLDLLSQIQANTRLVESEAIALNR